MSSFHCELHSYIKYLECFRIRITCDFICSPFDDTVQPPKPNEFTFRLHDYSVLLRKSVSILAESKITLREILRKGQDDPSTPDVLKLDNVEVHLDLVNGTKKIGNLVICLTGRFKKPLQGASGSSSSTATSNGTVALVNGNKNRAPPRPPAPQQGQGVSGSSTAGSGAPHYTRGNGGAVVSVGTGGSSAPEGPLPPGWEVRFDQYGRRYYVDHTTKSTT